MDFDSHATQGKNSYILESPSNLKIGRCHADTYVLYTSLSKGAQDLIQLDVGRINLKTEGYKGLQIIQWTN